MNSQGGEPRELVSPRVLMSRSPIKPSDFPIYPATRVVGWPQGSLRWGSHRSGRAGFPHPALRVKGLLSDGKYCEQRVREAEDHVAGMPRTEPTVAWRWIGG